MTSRTRAGAQLGRKRNVRAGRRTVTVASTVVALAALPLASVVGCRGEVSLGDPAARASQDPGTPPVVVAPPDAPQADWDTDPEPPPFVPTKVDLLFVVDDSGGMAGARAHFRESAAAIVDHLIRPRCVSDEDPPRPTGPALDGACASGRLELPPVRDLHVGVVTTSLGARGGDLCAYPEADGRGRLRRAAGAGADFSSWQAAGDPEAMGNALRATLDALPSNGCGHEATLEGWYRFLVQPDPYAEVVALGGGRAALDGVDAEVLRQRRAFLRPDSLVLIVLVTNENDASLDPEAFGGRAPRFLAGVRVKGGTSACAASPWSIGCMSCFLDAAQGDPACADVLPAAADPLELRFFEPRRRFGVDPRFPVARYVAGLSDPRVPDRHGEHPSGAFDYVGEPSCRNPLFAAALPGGAGEELCRRARGPRRKEHVLFALVGGVPPDLLRVTPDDPESPFRSELGDGWVKLVGRAPERYDFTGSDPRMREVMVAGEPEPTLQAACDVPSGGAVGSEAGGGFPPLQQLAVARGLGDRGVVGSVCPGSGDAWPPSPAALSPTTDAIVARAARVLRDGR